MKASLIAGCFAGLWLAGPAAAHHSMAGFDRNQSITLSGTVRQFRWANPHAWIAIEVPNAKGETITWSVEMTAPAYLAAPDRPSV